jgi:hypothetical protein
MRGRIRTLLVAGALTAGAVAGLAAAAPPIPEAGILKPAQVLPSPCTPTNDYEGKLSSGYGDACRRLHFTFGPIHAKPGQNDVLIEPVTIQKPAYPGYVVRFRPDLVDVTGTPPGIEEIHLHHATWLNVYPQYGSGLPFFAAGEEKTIATFPPGYGMEVRPADTWLLLYMVHNLTPTPREVWITYDIDFIAEQDAKRLGIVPVRPIWLDVQGRPIAPGATDTSGNPVFNVQRGFGATDTSLYAGRLGNVGPGTGKQVCTWPLQNCARHDVYGNVTPQQGKPLDPEKGVLGADWEVPAEFEGTLIGIGGHLHPGGIRDEVSLVRPGVGEKPIFVSDAVYWDRSNGKQAGGPITSWDFSMSVTGSTIGWKVKIKKGDVLRLNAVYDSDVASWYENMGISVALVSPKATEREDAFHGGSGVDVFDQPVAIDAGFPTTATPTPNRLIPTCAPNRDPAAGPLRLCLRGQVTHDHLREAGVFGGCGDGQCPGLTRKQGPVVDNLVSLGFRYGAADIGMIDQTGIPRLRKGQKTTFWNVDTVADVWHTFTRCKEPCTGATGLDYLLADASTGPDDLMDFDSTELGYGLFFSPASGQIGGSNKSTDEAIKDGLFWEFTPTQTGVYSLYCRIHPFMRGAFEVVE